MTSIGLLQRSKAAALVEPAALKCLAVVPFVAVRELDVKQQVGNTCAPRALITGLESLYCTEELQATSYGDIDETTEEVGAEWIQPHLDACDREGRITVIDSICIISDAQHHEKILTFLLNMFVPTKTTFIRPHCEHSNSAGNGPVFRPRPCASTVRRVVRSP
jgi:hypothetical protein